MKTKIKNYIQSNLLDGSLELSDQDELLLGGLIDSVGIMKLIGFIEEEFSVNVPAEDMVIENFSTVEAIEKYLIGTTK